jgi:heme exporter protein CcmD
VSYVIAAYGITGLTLVLYASYLVRERARTRKTLARTQETNNG